MNNTDKTSELEFAEPFHQDWCELGADTRIHIRKQFTALKKRIAELEQREKVMIEALEYINAGDDVAHGLSRPMMMDAASAALQKIKESTNSKGE